MKATFDRRGAIAIVTMHGSLIDSAASEFREDIENYASKNDGIVDWVLDLNELAFLDSAGLGVLVAFLKRVAAKGGDIKIARLQKKVRMVFQITRAFRVFQAFDTIEEAMAACGKNR